MDDVIATLEEAFLRLPENLRKEEWKIEDGYKSEICLYFDLDYPEITSKPCEDCDCDNVYGCPDFDWGEAAGSEPETIACEIYSHDVAKFFMESKAHLPELISHVKDLRAATTPESLNLLDAIRQKDAEIVNLRQMVSTLTLQMRICLEANLSAQDDPLPSLPKVDLNRLEAMALAATRGQWAARKSNDVAKTMSEGSYIKRNGMFIEAVDYPNCWITPWTEFDDDDNNGWDDYEYIAAANPDTILALIHRLKAAERKSIAAIQGKRRNHSRR